MKRAILALVALTFSLSSQAQSLVVEEMDTIVPVNSTVATDNGFHIKVKNVSTTNVDIKVARAWNNPGCAFDSAYYCWDYCYDNVTDTSIGAVTIAPNAVSNDFSGHVYSPNTGATCMDSTRYVFFVDEGKNTTDTLSVWVYISAGPTMGTAEISVRNATLYPNPARDYFTVDAANGGSIAIYNTLGAMVKNETIERGKTRISTAGMPNGVYLYSINGEKVRRLIISH